MSDKGLSDYELAGTCDHGVSVMEPCRKCDRDNIGVEQWVKCHDCARSMQPSRAHLAPRMGRVVTICNECQAPDALVPSKLEGTTQLFEDLLAGVRAFIRDRGMHDGPHSEVTPPSFQGPTVTACAACELAYMEAEAKLDECVRDAVAASGE